MSKCIPCWRRAAAACVAMLLLSGSFPSRGRSWGVLWRCGVGVVRCTVGVMMLLLMMCGGNEQRGADDLELPHALASAAPQPANILVQFTTCQTSDLTTRNDCQHSSSGTVRHTGPRCIHISTPKTIEARYPLSPSHQLPRPTDAISRDRLRGCNERPRRMPRPWFPLQGGGYV